MAGNELSKPPQIDEVEVSLFGPGYGECILLHVGQHNWIIVDSCLNKNKRPVAIDYLRSIGEDPSKSVQLIVATHWHDDHVGGLGATLRECSSAQFVCSDALREEEFRTLVKAMKNRSMMTRSGVKEFNEIMDVLGERKKPQSKVATPKFATANRILCSASDFKSGLPYTCTIQSLSPSDAEIMLAKQVIAGLIPVESKPKKAIVARRPNQVAVVLWISVGDLSILLGSDLEETSDPSTGWSVIVDSKGKLPNGKATVFKVPHHGSKNGHQPRVWNEMLEDEPVAILTPFINGKTILPEKGDASRICLQTSIAYSTASTKERQIKSRSNVVNKTISEAVKSIREVPSATGHIRLRKNILAGPGIAWKVELFGTALHLRELCA